MTRLRATTLAAVPAHLDHPVWRVRAALRVIALDQTFGIGVGPEGEEHVLLVAWGDPFGHLSLDEAEDLVARRLAAAGWLPEHGPEAAADLAVDLELLLPRQRPEVEAAVREAKRILAGLAPPLDTGADVAHND